VCVLECEGQGPPPCDPWRSATETEDMTQILEALRAATDAIIVAGKEKGTSPVFAKKVGQMNDVPFSVPFGGHSAIGAKYDNWHN